MQPELICFSATGTTAKIVAAIAEGTGMEAAATHSLLHVPAEVIPIAHDRLVVIGVPVFSGRVPEAAREGLAKVKGDRTPAILVCVYGNREFDDALAELHDIAVGNGFVPVAAAAFVAQHSIFPAVGTGRPDAADLAAARAFGRCGAELAAAWSAETETAEIRGEASGTSIGAETGRYAQKAGAKSMINTASDEAGNAADTPQSIPGLHIRGNRPYREYKRVPLSPRTSRKCNGCGACAKGCPAHAIDAADPRRTDKALCTACAHCIAVCPRQARHFGGLLYRFAARKFGKAYSERREPYIVYE